ncbi:MAG: hypothetical protein AB7E73_12520, partial [Burkholderiales bacterium]
TSVEEAVPGVAGRLPGAVVRSARRMGRAFAEGGIEAVGAMLERGADRLADRAEERATSVEEAVPGVAGRLPGAVVRSARRMGRAFAEGGIEAVGAMLERGADRLADRAEERATSVEEAVPGTAGRLPGAVVRGARIVGQILAEGRAGAAKEFVDSVIERTGDILVRDVEAAVSSIPLVYVWDGAVELADKTILQEGSGLRLIGGELVAIGRQRNDPAGSEIPRPDLVKIASGALAGSSDGAAPGLYVWVRDGEVSLTKDVKTIDVPKGNAGVATRDDVKLLDAVPNFMRFDPTPLPAFSLITKLDVFRLPDGALQNMCTIR